VRRSIKCYKGSRLWKEKEVFITVWYARKYALLDVDAVSPLHALEPEVVRRIGEAFFPVFKRCIDYKGYPRYVYEDYEYLRRYFEEHGAIPYYLDKYCRIGVDNVYSSVKGLKEDVEEALKKIVSILEEHGYKCEEG